MKHPTTKSFNSYAILALFAVSLWALSPLSMSLLIDIPVAELSAFIFLFAFIGFCISCYASPVKVKGPLYPKSRRTWIVGITCLVAMQFLYTYTFRFLSPEQAEITYYLWPFFLTFYCVFSRVTPFSKTHLLALALCFTGVYTCLAPSKSSDQELMQTIIGSMIALGGAIAWSYYSFYCKSRPKETTDYQTSLFAGPSFIICLGVHFCTESFVLPSPEQLIMIAFIGIVIMNVSLAMWKRSITHGNFRIVSLFPYFVPVLSVVFLIIAGKASYSHRLVISAALVSLGTLIPCLSFRRVKSTC